MDRILHHLDTSIQPPRQFTYPFCYEPHPLCVAAAGEVQRHIVESGVWHGEQSPGKMFGVLVVEQTGGGLAFLAAYSGLLAGRNDWPYFVPPVFDAQRPDGHFKQTEREISGINRELEALEKSDAYQTQLALYESVRQASDAALVAMRAKVTGAKARRDARRHDAECGGVPLTPGEQEAMVRESQHLKADLHRLRRQTADMLAGLHRPIEEHDTQVAALRSRRREMSDALQRWLFSQYDMLNARGERRNLVGIFGDAIHALPPAGAGDCCAPKLLQYAYIHGLRPVCMAEFWWGDSPRQEVRHHLHYYPACRSKCLPILTYMLQGLDVEPNPLAQLRTAEKPRIVYEDSAIVVVDKPAGMLSVPGKTLADGCGSVEDYVRQVVARHDVSAESPFVRAVHRLDMDTSGLLVLAKTSAAYVELQRQFASREVSKCYEAVLDGIPSSTDGTVCLPLIADIMDRPRQRVDFVAGKYAVTDYHVVATRADGTALVLLRPHTGRTHQLRVHCAHTDGLGCPILGDPLYGRGTPAKRMYLHAAMVEFRHPVTGERMRLESPSGW